MSWWEKLGDVQKAVTALAVVAATVLTAALLLGDLISLPDAVEANTRNIRSNSEIIGTLKGSVEEQNEKIDQMLCLQLVEKTGGRWEDCLRGGR